MESETEGSCSKCKKIMHNVHVWNYARLNLMNTSYMKYYTAYKLKGQLYEQDSHQHPVIDITSQWNWLPSATSPSQQANIPGLLFIIIKNKITQLDKWTCMPLKKKYRYIVIDIVWQKQA